MRFSTCMSSAVLALALIASAPGWAADISASTWTESAAGNNANAPEGWPSGTMQPNQVAPTARELMGAVKRWYNRSNATKTSAGSANVQTLTYTVPTTAYVAGDGYTFIAGFTNTGATTLNIDGLGAKAVKIGTSALGGGELVASRIVRVYYDGTAFQIEGGDSAIVVGTNVALKTITGGAGRRVWRDGFTTAGDGGAAPYLWSASNCSAADDGKQVQPSVTGCWIADFSGMKPTPKIWGAVGDGVTNDRAAVQAAITAMANNTLYLGPYRYGLATGVSCASPMRIEGEGRSAVGLEYSGFVQLSQNITLLTLCSRSYFGNFSIEAGGAGVNTSGAAMVSGAATTDIILANVWIDKPCIGVDINGNSHSIDRFYITRHRGAGCGGIRVGNLTTAGATVDLHVNRTTISSDFIAEADRSDYGILIKDAGGMFLTGTDILFSQVGTHIKPGNGQFVQWMYAGDTTLGDTTVNQGLLIDTAHSGGVVKGAHFVNAWTSSSTTSHGIQIANAASGTVDGIHFTAHRSYANGANGATITAGSDITFDASQFCHNALAGVGVGVSWASGVSYGAIRNSTLKADCDGFGANSNFQNAVHYIGTNDAMILTGNELGGAGGAILGAPIGRSVVQANRGLDDTVPATLTAAASINSSAYPSIIIAGATPVTDISGCWEGRRILIRAGGGNVQFNTGGNIMVAYTALNNVPVVATCYQTAPSVWNWYFGG